MASHYPSNSFPNSENANQSEPVAEQPFTQTQKCVLSEAAQRHMQLIGTFLVQIIQEWNARHQPCASSPDSESEQVSNISEREP